MMHPSIKRLRWEQTISTETNNFTFLVRLAHNVLEFHPIVGSFKRRFCLNTVFSRWSIPLITKDIFSRSSTLPIVLRLIVSLMVRHDNRIIDTQFLCAPSSPMYCWPPTRTDCHRISSLHDQRGLQAVKDVHKYWLFGFNTEGYTFAFQHCALILMETCEEGT